MWAFSMSCHRKPTLQQPRKAPCWLYSLRKCATIFQGMMYPTLSACESLLNATPATLPCSISTG